MGINDLVSVVVPVYNVQEHLRECLDSLVRQSYSNIEIIIVNDGSTDQSEVICHSFVEKDDRIKYLFQENRGLSAARNTGIYNASGKYICFIDSDDYIHEDYIKKLYGILISNEADMSMCGYIREGKFATEFDDEKCEVVEGKTMMRHFYSYDVLLMNIVCNKLYRIDLFQNEKFPEGMLYEDFALNARIMYSCKKIAVCNDKLYFYRRNENGITMSHFSVHKLDALKQIENRLVFFYKVGEKSVYNRFLQEYEIENLKFFYLTKKYLKNRSIEKDLRKKYSKYFFEALSAKENRGVAKLYILLGLFFPFLMGYITSIWDK